LFNGETETSEEAFLPRMAKRRERKRADFLEAFLEGDGK